VDEKLKVLIVEDNLPQAVQMTRMLDGRDYELAFAATATEGLANACRRRPDVVISDAAMPGLGGFALCRLVKRDETLKGVPVILVTSSLYPEDMIQALNARADYCLARPFDATRLADAIECVCGLAPNGSKGAGDASLGFALAAERFVVDAPRGHMLALWLDAFGSAWGRTEAPAALRPKPVTDESRPMSAAPIPELAAGNGGDRPSYGRRCPTPR
jgi:CheY-like chemotaxis protein